jgi:hypothetical protein
MKGRLRIMKKNEKLLRAVIGSPAACPRSLPLVQQRVPQNIRTSGVYRWAVSF